MTFLSSVLFGILQGLTEFLPVSSSGHLSLAQIFFGFSNVEENYMAFNILLHLGTLGAVVVAYFSDIVTLIAELFEMIGDIFRGRGLRLHRPYRRLGVMIIVSILPLFAVLPVKDKIEAASKSPLFIGVALLATGTLLFLSDRMPKSGKEIRTAKMGDGLKVGIFQALATIPGLSRSGATIAGGRLSGFSAEFSLQFSFLMSIPAVLGANILNIKDLSAAPPGELPIYLAGAGAAFLAGLLAIFLLKWLARKKNFRVFAYYCLFVGTAAILYNFFR